MSADFLTAELLRQLFHYDPETGLFTNLVRRGPRALVGMVAGSIGAKGYAEIMISGYSYKVSRLACLYMTGEWPTYEMDHINRIRHDNRWSNLRDITHQENLVHRDSPIALRIA